MFNVKYVLLNEQASQPEFKTNGSGGFDFSSAVDTIVPVGKRVMIKTGLKIEFPIDYALMIHTRSSLSTKYGIVLGNGSAGVIDSDYRGEIMICLWNTGEEDFTVSVGDRIAQGVFTRVASKSEINLIQVQETNLSETERGSGGFGSTGK